MPKKLQKKLEIISKNMDFLEDAYRVKSLGVFGSVARGRENKNSDIDILIEFYRPVGFFKFLELEDFLGKILKQKVDLVSKKGLKPAIKEDVLKEVVYV